MPPRADRHETLAMNFGIPADLIERAKSKNLLRAVLHAYTRKFSPEATKDVIHMYQGWGVDRDGMAQHIMLSILDSRLNHHEEIEKLETELGMQLPEARDAKQHFLDKR